MKLLSLNHYWRIFAAGLSYAVFGIGAFVPGVYIFFVALTPISAATKQRKVRNSIKGLCRFYINFMQFLGLMSYRIQGNVTDNPRGVLITCNHTMLIDALFILAYVDNVCCVVKASLVTNPFTRIPVKLAGYISNSDAQFAELATQKLSAGENILIFPEGTRNQHHDLQLTFRRGAANIAVLSHAPILPLVLCCVPRALGKNDKWYELPAVKSQITMLFNPIIDINNCIDTTLPRTLQYRKLTQWLHDYYYDAISTVIGSAKDNVTISH